MDREVGDSDWLNMDVFYLNDYVVPEGRGPMIVIYGALPRPKRYTETPSQIHCNVTVQREMEAVNNEIPTTYLDWIEPFEPPKWIVNFVWTVKITKSVKLYFQYILPYRSGISNWA